MNSWSTVQRYFVEGDHVVQSEVRNYVALLWVASCAVAYSGCWGCGAEFDTPAACGWQSE